MSQEGEQGEQGIIRRMLAAARAGAPARPRPGDDEISDYTWGQPHRYGADALTRLDALTGQFAAEVSRAMGELLDGEIEFKSVPTAQCYAGRVADAVGEGEVYHTELTGPGVQECGLVAMPTGAAAEWVARLLGAQPAEDERELSALETDLLLGLLRAVAEGISSASRAAGGPQVAQGQRLRRGRLALPGGAADEYCCFQLRAAAEEDDGAKGDEEESNDNAAADAADAHAAADASSGSAILFLLRCDAVDGMLGIEQSPGEPSQSNEQARQWIAAHVHAAALILSVRLGEAEVSMREVMKLEPGDVISLARRSDQPAEIVVRDKTLLLANPVSCAGRYGVQVVCWADGQAQQAPAAAGR